MGFDIDAWPVTSSEADRREIDAAFNIAEEEARRLGNGVDSFLSLGSLDCGLSIQYFLNAIGRDGRPPDVWPMEEVRTLGESAHWPDPSSIPPDELWGYWSARKFLEVCMAYPVMISFT